MEEIDIIELLQRVKEGKAPKKIEVADRIFVFEKLEQDYYRVGIDDGYYSLVDEINIFDMFNTKIKILDKPIIKPLDDLDLTNARPETNARKINEIIDFINNKE